MYEQPLVRGRGCEVDFHSDGKERVRILHIIYSRKREVCLLPSAVNNCEQYGYHVLSRDTSRRETQTVGNLHSPAILNQGFHLLSKLQDVDTVFTP